MKLKDATEDLICKIVQLESDVMIPILSAVGINITPSEMHIELMKDRDQIITTIIDNDNLKACLRMSFEGEDLYVKSICLAKDANRYILKRLLIKASESIKLSNVKKIKSVVQKSNLSSISFHEKLGFQREKENDKAIGFFMQAEKLKVEIQRRFL